MTTTTATRYNPIIIGLHWFMLVLFIAVYAFIELRGIFPKGTEARDLMKAMHFMLGISVLILVVIRLAVRFSSPTPAIVPTPSLLENLLAKIMHTALYVLMILMPIMGWLILSAEGHGVPFFGLELPPLIAEDADAAERIEEFHKLGGLIGYYLIGLHALAGLFHHYVKRDNVLHRMLFKRK